MMSTKLVVAVLGTAVAAAGTGGYVALRQNAAEQAAAPYEMAAPVHMSEAIVPEPVSEPAPRPREAAFAPPVAVTEARPVARQAAPRVSAPRAVTEAAAPAPAPEPRTGAPAAAPAAAPVEEARPRLPEPTRIELEPASLPAPEIESQDEVLTIEPDSVIGIRLDSNVSSGTAEVEDRVTARVSRDVTVDGRSAISSGARLEGVVASVERGGKFKDRARIGVRFNSLVLDDGTRLPIETETIFRESESPTGKAAAKVGASAAIGGVLGAVFGGKKGAAIGSTVGAAGGTAAVMTGEAPDAVLQAGMPLTVRLTAPLTVTIQRDDE
jgi:hypothetical protein